jgi:phosphinothricin acetyltransferase
MIREMQKEDWPEVAEIYRYGLETRNATFETEVPAWEFWDEHHIEPCRIVYCDDPDVLGWAALSKVSHRKVYAGVAEVSVYVAKESIGKGIGTKLLQEIVTRSEAHGFWTLQSSLFPENPASVKMHEKFGFRKMGIREKVAQLDGIWRDTLIMERRSQKVGVDK